MVSQFSLQPDRVDFLFLGVWSTAVTAVPVSNIRIRQRATVDCATWHSYPTQPLFPPLNMPNDTTAAAYVSFPHYSSRHKLLAFASPVPQVQPGGMSLHHPRRLY